MTSPYKRPSAAQTLAEDEGRLNEKITFWLYNSYCEFSGVFNKPFQIPFKVTVTSKLG